MTSAFDVSIEDVRAIQFALSRERTAPRGQPQSCEIAELTMASDCGRRSRFYKFATAAARGEIFENSFQHVLLKAIQKTPPLLRSSADLGMETTHD
jgi:hypothetical protein